LYTKLGTIGNLVHGSVPVSNNEDNNELIRKWTPEGVTVERRDCLSHHDVLFRLDGYEAERGVKVVGHRGYFLKRWGVFLNQALINYGLEFLESKGYSPLQTPQFMLKGMMAKTAQLEQFDDELYKVCIVSCMWMSGPYGVYRTVSNRFKIGCRWRGEERQVLDCYLRAAYFRSSCR